MRILKQCRALERSAAPMGRGFASLQPAQLPPDAPSSYKADGVLSVLHQIIPFPGKEEMRIT